MPRSYLLLMLFAALFTLSKVENQLKCLPTDKWIKIVFFVFNRILFNFKEVENPVTSSNIGEPRQHHVATK